MTDALIKSGPQENIALAVMERNIANQMYDFWEHLRSLGNKFFDLQEKDIVSLDPAARVHLAGLIREKVRRRMRVFWCSLLGVSASILAVAFAINPVVFGAFFTVGMFCGMFCDGVLGRHLVYPKQYDFLRSALGAKFIPEAWWGQDGSDAKREQFIKELRGGAPRLASHKEEKAV